MHQPLDNFIVNIFLEKKNKVYSQVHKVINVVLSEDCVLTDVLYSRAVQKPRLIDRQSE